MATNGPWTIIGSTAAAVAIGTGILLGREDDSGALREPISLTDSVPIAAASSDDDEGPGIKVIPPKAWSANGAFDSPNSSPQQAAPPVRTFDSPDNSPPQQAAPPAGAFDSPDNSPQAPSAPAAAPASLDSPDGASFDSPDGSA
jgi:hypothetical protein